MTTQRDTVNRTTALEKHTLYISVSVPAMSLSTQFQRRVHEGKFRTAHHGGRTFVSIHLLEGALVLQHRDHLCRIRYNATYRTVPYRTGGGESKIKHGVYIYMIHPQATRHAVYVTATYRTVPEEVKARSNMIYIYIYMIHP